MAKQVETCFTYFSGMEHFADELQIALETARTPLVAKMKEVHQGRQPDKNDKVQTKEKETDALTTDLLVHKISSAVVQQLLPKLKQISASRISVNEDDDDIRSVISFRARGPPPTIEGTPRLNQIDEDAAEAGASC